MQFENTETFVNLARSFAGECQAGMRYQMIAKLAMKEGLKTLADAIRTIAKNETLHATQFFNKIIEKTGSRDAARIKYKAFLLIKVKNLLGCFFIINLLFSLRGLLPQLKNNIPVFSKNFQKLWEHPP